MFHPALWRKYKWIALLLLLVTVAGCLPGLRYALQVNNSLQVWFPHDSRELGAYRLFHQRFGSDEQVVLLLPVGDGLRQKEMRERLQKLHRELVACEEIRLVQSPADLRLPVVGPAGVQFRQFLGLSAQQQANVLAEYPVIRQQLFSADGQSVKMIVLLNAELDIDANRGRMVALVQQMAERHWPAEEVAMGGIPVVFAALNALTEAQFGRFVPLTYAVMLLFLALLFGSWRVCAVALLTMGTATMLSLGWYGSLGHQLNLMTVLIPLVVLLLSSLDLVHLLYAWKRNPSGGLSAAVAKVWQASLLTTLTTMLGFLSLLWSPMAILQQFGLFSAIGIGLCLPLTYFFAAWLLPASTKALSAPESLQRASNWYGMVYANRRLWMVGVLLLFALFGWGIGLVRSDTYTLGYLPQSSKTVRDHERLAASLGHYLPLELLLEAPEGGSLTDSAGLHRLWQLSARLHTAGFQPQLGLPQLLALSANRLGAFDTAAMASLAPEALALAEAHFPDWLAQLYHAESGTGRLTIFGPMMSAGKLLDNIEELKGVAAGQAVEVQPAGYLPLYAQLVPLVTSSQTRSLLLAAALIALLLGVYLRSWRLVAVVMLTQLFPLAGMFAWMGWFNLDLDIATASIACIGLSYCVDDSIHFVLSYRRHRRQGDGHQTAMVHTLAETGHAIVLSSLMLSLGFACMMFSSLKTVFLFGMLSAVMVVLALFAQLVIFGLLMHWLWPDESKSKEKTR